MTKNKTTYTEVNVLDFISSYVDNDQKKADSFHLIKLMRKWSGFEPKMWGPSIIGFGNYHYKYASGHEGDAPLAAFSPRKDSLVLYVATEFEKREELLSKLGKHTSSKSCVYAKKLDDLDIAVLKKVIKNSMDQALKEDPAG